MTRQDAIDVYAGCSIILARAELSDWQREVVVAHNVRGVKLEDIARRRGVTKQAVSLVEQKALARLAHVLAPLREQLAA